MLVLRQAVLARVRTRTRQGLGQSSSGSGTSRLIGAGLELDPRSYDLVIDGTRIKLSQREFMLLANLLDRTRRSVPARSFSRAFGE